MNLALLGKWWWRFLHEKHKLWARVVISRGGAFVEKLMRGKDGRPRGSTKGWWSKIGEGLGGDQGGWFKNNLKRELGNGMYTSFWEDKWGDEGPLKVRFLRLYRLSGKKDGKVGEMGEWVDGSWRWALCWRQRLADREVEGIRDLERYFEGVTLRQDCLDKWKWGENKEGEYTVRKAYRCITQLLGAQNEATTGSEVARKVWRSIAPFKHQAMAWRAIRDRLPTRDNLHKRFELSPEGRLCPCCATVTESANHILLLCEEVEIVWRQMVGWIGSHWAAPATLTNHFKSFSRLLKGKHMSRKLGGLWICILWVIWRWRNKVVFENWSWEFKKMEEEIKCRFWSWCAVKGYTDPRGSLLVWSGQSLGVTWNAL